MREAGIGHGADGETESQNQIHVQLKTIRRLTNIGNTRKLPDPDWGVCSALLGFMVRIKLQGSGFE